MINPTTSYISNLALLAREAEDNLSNEDGVQDVEEYSMDTKDREKADKLWD